LQLVYWMPHQQGGAGQACRSCKQTHDSCMPQRSRSSSCAAVDSSIGIPWE
jgi:hypothetical protein